MFAFAVGPDAVLPANVGDGRVAVGRWREGRARRRSSTTRFDAPVLMKPVATVLRTVCALMPSNSAISRFVSPSATHCTTSRSRGASEWTAGPFGRNVA